MGEGGESDGVREVVSVGGGLENIVVVEKRREGRTRANSLFG